MSRRVLLFLFFSILFIISIYFVFDSNVYEKVYDINTNSGDNSFEHNNYDIYITEDQITFNDSRGNSILYVFENDRLKNVFSVYNAKNDVEAKKIANYFSIQIGSGEIYDVNCVGTTVSVQMDINYFSEYKDFSKKQIEEILLENAKDIEGDMLYENE